MTPHNQTATSHLNMKETFYILLEILLIVYEKITGDHPNSVAAV
jgi:hypothetical protein